jgi:hypothetical protein
VGLELNKPARSLLGIVDLSTTSDAAFFREVHLTSEMACQHDGRNNSRRFSAGFRMGPVFHWLSFWFSGCWRALEKGTTTSWAGFYCSVFLLLVPLFISFRFFVLFCFLL